MNKKLFIITRRDLSGSQQAVQSGHSVAEFLIKYPNTKWNNGILVYLGVKNEKNLQKWMLKMYLWKVPCVCFHEPDMNNELTSIASFYDESFFKNLQVL